MTEAEALSLAVLRSPALTQWIFEEADKQNYRLNKIPLGEVINILVTYNESKGA